MDARTDLRLVKIRQRTAAAGHRLRDIYTFIYRTAPKTQALWRYLTRRHKRRRPRRARASRDAIKDRHDRPKTFESRSEVGHWEGDLIISKCTGPRARLARA
jgi:IS30 family transposase